MEPQKTKALIKTFTTDYISLQKPKQEDVINSHHLKPALNANTISKKLEQNSSWPAQACLHTS
jgi:hypothetical protein